MAQKPVPPVKIPMPTGVKWVVNSKWDPKTVLTTEEDESLLSPVHQPGPIRSHATGSSQLSKWKKIRMGHPKVKTKTPMQPNLRAFSTWTVFLLAFWGRGPVSLFVVFKRNPFKVGPNPRKGHPQIGTTTPPKDTHTHARTHVSFGLPIQHVEKLPYRKGRGPWY